MRDKIIEQLQTQSDAESPHNCSVFRIDPVGSCNQGNSTATKKNTIEYSKANFLSMYGEPENLDAETKIESKCLGSSSHLELPSLNLPVSRKQKINYLLSLQPSPKNMTTEYLESNDYAISEKKYPIHKKQIFQSQKK